MEEDQPSGHAASGGGGGYGPYFGSIPDFGQEENGVKFSDVRPESPAAKAGFKAGDVLVEFGDKPIHNLYDFTDALRRSKVGDVVEVKVMRGGKPVTRLSETGTTKVDGNECRNCNCRPALFLLISACCASLWWPFSQAPVTAKVHSETLTVAGEKHLGNVRQLTFGGTNAEAYFSADDKSLIFMHSGEGVPCDQMYTMPVDTPDGKPAHAETGEHRQGSHHVRLFLSAGDRILFSSTHEASAACPPRPDYSHGYVWPIYSSYQIYTAKPDGSDLAPP